MHIYRSDTDHPTNVQTAGLDVSRSVGTAKCSAEAKDERPVQANEQ